MKALIKLACHIYFIMLFSILHIYNIYSAKILKWSVQGNMDDFSVKSDELEESFTNSLFLQRKYPF